MAKKVAQKLAPREEQIMGVIYQLGTASVTQVRDAIDDPPSYSAVRTMLGHLEKKGLLKRDRSDVTHKYSAIRPKVSARRSAIRRLLDVFFPNQPAAAIAALIDESAKDLTQEELNELQNAIDKAKTRSER